MSDPTPPLTPTDYRANSLHWLVGDLILLVVFGLSAVYQRITFQKLFSDFDVKLPLLTQVMLSVPLAGVLGIVVILGVLLVAKEFLIRAVPVRRLWNIWIGLILITILVVHVLALLLPLTDLMRLR